MIKSKNSGRTLNYQKYIIKTIMLNNFITKSIQSLRSRAQSINCRQVITINEKFNNINNAKHNQRYFSSTEESTIPFELHHIALNEIDDPSFALYYQNIESSNPDKKNAISLWHDIPLRSTLNDEHQHDQVFNFITEIPKLSTAKLEIATNVSWNPIIQDVTKTGEPRHYCGPIYWNYGCLPQTWEDPNEEIRMEGVNNPKSKKGYDYQTLSVRGDNDPVDVVEIGSQTLDIGSVTPVSIIGGFALIDDGELDWKLIALNVNDPIYEYIKTIEDLQEYQPWVISGICEWFRWYKVGEGKSLNAYGGFEHAFNKDFMHEVITETNQYWKNLIESGGVNDEEENDNEISVLRYYK